MTDMFAGCEQLVSVNLSGLNTETVGTMEQMFAGCESLQTLDLSNFTDFSLQTMEGMFNGCLALTSLDIRGFEFGENTGNAPNMTDTFYNINVNCVITVGSQYAKDYLINTASISGLDQLTDINNQIVIAAQA